MKSYKILYFIILFTALSLCTADAFAIEDVNGPVYNIFETKEPTKSEAKIEKIPVLNNVKKLFSKKKIDKEEIKFQKTETVTEPPMAKPLDTLGDLDNMVKDQTQKIEIQKIKKKDFLNDGVEISNDKIDLISDNVEFYPEIQQFIAVGDSEIVIKSERFRMKANEIILGQQDNSIVGIGNVRIYKDENELTGDYIKIDTKRESAFIRKPFIQYGLITVNAKTANVYSNKIDAYDGTMNIDRKSAMIFSTSAFGNIVTPRIFDPALMTEGTKKNYRITTKQIIVKREVDRTITTLKNATIYRNNFKVATMDNLELSNDREMKHIENDMVEMGKRPRTDPFIAPAYVFQLPKGSTLKAGPLFSYGGGNRFGVGAFGRLLTEKNRTELYYSSAKDYVVLNGNYKFNNDFSLQYTMNDYLNNGFMGSQMPKYGMELMYDKTTNLDDIGLISTNRLSGGYFQDFDTSVKSMRLKWQASNSTKPFWSYGDYLKLGLIEQHDVSLYEGGKTVVALRAGPALTSDIGKLNLRLFYFMGGVSGESPMTFDRYMYGRQNVQFMAQYYLNKYLSLAYYGSVTPLKDNWENQWLTENQLIVSVGTEDVKLRLGFDLIRNMSVIGFDFLLGSDKTRVDFDKMHMIDYDKAKRGKKKKAEPIIQPETPMVSQQKV